MKTIGTITSTGGNAMFTAKEGSKLVHITNEECKNTVKVNKEDYYKFMEGEYKEDIKGIDDAYYYFS